MRFQEKLSALMLRQGLTQEALAQALGVAQSSVARWLTGSIPHRARLAQLAEIFGVRPEALLDDSDLAVVAAPNSATRVASLEAQTKSVAEQEAVAKSNDGNRFPSLGSQTRDVPADRPGLYEQAVHEAAAVRGLGAVAEALEKLNAVVERVAESQRLMLHRLEQMNELKGLLEVERARTQDRDEAPGGDAPRGGKRDRRTA